MAQDVTQIVNLGAAQVLVSTNNFSSSTDLGLTDETGVKVDVKTSVILAKVARYGDTPVAGWVNGQVAEIEATFSQSQYSLLASMIPAATINTSATGTQNMQLGVTAGTQLVPFSIKLKSTLAALTPLWDVTAVNVILTGAFDMGFTGKKEQQWKVKFAVLVNQSAVNGANILTIGDTTITADVTPPTVSGVVPANGATSVAHNTAVTWTMSENIAQNTVTASAPAPTVLLFLDPTGGTDTGDLIAGTVVLTNNGSSTTIVFTPTSALGTTKKYFAVLNGITDLAGNQLGLYTSEFTTT